MARHAQNGYATAPGLHCFCALFGGTKTFLQWHIVRPMNDEMEFSEEETAWFCSLENTRAKDDSMNICLCHCLQAGLRLVARPNLADKQQGCQTCVGPAVP